MHTGSLGSKCGRLAYSHIAFPALRTMTRVNPLVTYYHVVSDRDVPHVDNLYLFRSVSQFKRDIAAFLKFFRQITFKEFLDSLNETDLLRRKPLCLHSNAG